MAAGRVVLDGTEHGVAWVGRQATARIEVELVVDMDLVAAYSSRIVALSGGKVLADLPPDRFFADATLIEAVVGKRRSQH